MNDVDFALRFLYYWGPTYAHTVDEQAKTQYSCVGNYSLFTVLVMSVIIYNRREKAKITRKGFCTQHLKQYFY